MSKHHVAKFHVYLISALHGGGWLTLRSVRKPPRSPLDRPKACPDTVEKKEIPGLGRDSKSEDLDQRFPKCGPRITSDPCASCRWSAEQLGLCRNYETELIKIAFLLFIFLNTTNYVLFY